MYKFVPVGLYTYMINSGGRPYELGFCE